ncbi:substrate-binding domain-containing protein, partial [Xanthomonas citri]
MTCTQGVGRAPRQLAAGVRGITRHLQQVLVLCSLGLVAAGCTREPSSPTARASHSAAASAAAPASTAAPATTPSAASAPPPTPDPHVLRVCADPGNMPLSNKAGEGFQNKIAQVVADAMGRRLEYEWRTYYQRGLARSTINAGRCDVLMDLNSDFEQGLTTRPVYRSAYVLVTRQGLSLRPTSLDDPALKKLRLGVFQSSPARQALYEHGISGEVQYLFYDSATAPEEHPGKLVERVAANTLDAAESWGPVAGYYAQRSGLGLVPLNTIDDAVLEYSMAWAVSRKNADLRDALNTALQQSAAKIAEILRRYHVPLVRCRDCVVAGELASHGPYVTPTPASTVPSPAASSQELAQLQLRIADGADPNQELAHALDAGDAVRAAWL